MTESEGIDPPRPRKSPLAKWAWRGFVAVVVLGTLLGVAFWVWSARVERQFQARLRELHDAGEPIYPQDFVTAAPAAGTNAAEDLIAAGAVAGKKDEASAAFDDLSWLGAPLTDQEVKVLSAYVEGRHEVFGWVEAAAGKPAVWWDIDYSQPTVLADPPGWREARAAGNVLRSDALLAHHRGDHRTALLRARQIDMIGRAIDRQPTLVSHLVAIGLQAMAADLVEWVAPDLKVGGEAGGSPAEVRALIDEFLDEGPLREGMINALRGERKDQWMLVDALVQGKMTVDGVSGGANRSVTSKGVGPLKAVFRGDADLMLRVMTGMIRQFEATSDLPGYRSGGAHRALAAEIETSPKRHMIAALLMPSVTRPIEVHYRCLTDRRLAAVALAARWYATEHDGRLPASLDELVPKYLPAVRVDPLAASGTRLRYRAGGDDPVVYSVGMDGRDDGGKGPAADEPPERWRGGKDAVLHLKRQPRYREPGDDLPVLPEKPQQ
jgi:hypothetical protein